MPRSARRTCEGRASCEWLQHGGDRAEVRWLVRAGRGLLAELRRLRWTRAAILVATGVSPAADGARSSDTCSWSAWRPRTWRSSTERRGTWRRRRGSSRPAADPGPRGRRRDHARRDRRRRRRQPALLPAAPGFRFRSVERDVLTPAERLPGGHHGRRHRAARPGLAGPASRRTERRAVTGDAACSFFTASARCDGIGSYRANTRRERARAGGHRPQLDGVADQLGGGYLGADQGPLVRRRGPARCPAPGRAGRTGRSSPRRRTRRGPGW